jgi:hypothetical protein
MGFNWTFNGLNPICHPLALLGAHHILYVSRIRIKHAISALQSSVSTCQYEVNEVNYFDDCRRKNNE